MRSVCSEEVLGIGAPRIDPVAPVAPHVQAAQSAGDLHFVQLAGILRRRMGLIFTSAAAGAALACAVGLLIPPKYSATAQIVVEPQQADFFGGLAGAPRVTDESAIDTHVTMLSSRDHLQRVLDSLSRERDSRAIAPLAETEADAFSSRWVYGKPSHPIGEDRPAASLASPAGALSVKELGRRLNVWYAALFGGGNTAARELDELERQLKVMQERRSRVISVSFTATSPERAAAVANRIAELHVARQSEEKRNQANRELVRLGERAAGLKVEMERTGEAMQQALERRAAAGPEGQESESRLRELGQDAAASGQTYAGLLRRQMEIRNQQASIAPDVNILSSAKPPDRPSSPNPILFVFPALIMSSIFGSLLAVLRDRLDRGLRSERDVTDWLGIPCIGLVPQLPRADSARLHRCLLTRPFTPYTEAIRSAVAALHVAATPSAPTTVLISSSVPGEGKSTMAASLAIYSASLGRRVLLVDFDFRHPSLLRQRHGNSKGFVPDLRDRPPADCVQRLSDLNIDYLPMPRPSVDPLALFTGQHVQILMRRLRDSYDCVFIDSPPLLGITEGRLLASFADKCLFVIKWSSTRREVAQNALNLLGNTLRSEDGSAFQATALLTQVDLKKHAEYHYGDAAETFVKYKKYYLGSARA
jgi:uncharacterized protein involved in exopolysaccharide biosynthesis/MinD-like ATPase involved in chromosome partitioning or flagellar assembly